MSKSRQKVYPVRINEDVKEELMMNLTRIKSQLGYSNSVIIHLAVERMRKELDGESNKSLVN